MARSGGLSDLARGMLLFTMFGHTSNIDLRTPVMGYVGLATSSVDPDKALREPPFSYRDATTGALIVTSYERAPIEMGPYTTAWGESGRTGVVNMSEIRFPTATGTWGTVKFWALLDAELEGNILAYGSLKNAVVVRDGESAVIPPGGLRISLDSYDTEW